MTLTPDERRLLILAMGIISLQDLVATANTPQGLSMPDDLMSRSKLQIKKSKAEYDKLFDRVNQFELIKKVEGK